jgi:hypothetical protein
MNRGANLPGNHHRATVKYRDPADRIIEIDRADVRKQIVAALAVRQPLFKWELREQLHIAEQVIYRELQTLRAAGKVKAVGQRRLDRKWALFGWRPALVKATAPMHPNEDTAIRTKKPEPAKDSWWTRPDLTREQFQERARRGTDRATQLPDRSP